MNEIKKYQYAIIWHTDRVDFVLTQDIDNISRMIEVRAFSKDGELHLTKYKDKYIGRIRSDSDGDAVECYNFAICKNKIEVIYDLKKIIVGQKDFNQPCSIGTVDYYGRLTRYMPYFALGSEIHFGRLATRGLGKYIIEEIH